MKQKTLLLLITILIPFISTAQQKSSWPTFTKKDSVVHVRAAGFWEYIAVQMEANMTDTSYFILMPATFQKVYDTINVKEHFRGKVPEHPNWDYEYRPAYYKAAFGLVKQDWWFNIAPERRLERALKNCASLSDTAVIQLFSEREQPALYNIADSESINQDSMIVLERLEMAESAQIILTKDPIPYLTSGRDIEIKAVFGKWTPPRMMLCTRCYGRGMSWFKVQENLNRLGYKLHLTGDFDEATRLALRNFSEKLGYEGKLTPEVMWLFKMRD